MSSETNFLPDFGDHLLKLSGPGTSRISGIFVASIASRYLDEYYSLSGGTAVEGVDYASTFDFDEIARIELAEIMRRIFYLDLVDLLGAGDHVGIEFKPRLRFHIDFEVRLGKPTHSEASGEQFVPVVVERVRDLSLCPSHDAILQRHMWWVEQSDLLVEELGEPMQSLSWAIQRMIPFDASLEMGQFYGNMLAFHIVRKALAEDKRDEVIAVVFDERWIDPSEKESVDLWLEQLKSKAIDSNRLTTCAVSLLTWYVSMALLTNSIRTAAARVG